MERMVFHRMTLSLLLALLLILSACQPPPPIAPTETTAAPETTPVPTQALVLPTEEDWAALALKNPFSTRTLELICALLSGDAARFAALCSVPAEVYADLAGIEITDYRLVREEIAAADNPAYLRAYPVLSFTVAKSESAVFAPGTHCLVFDAGIYITFTPRDEFVCYEVAPESPLTAAERYVIHLWGEDFSRTQDKYRKYSFIVQRLSALAGEDRPFTEAEIAAYAEKYLDTPFDPDMMRHTLYRDGDGWRIIGADRGGIPTCTPMGTEERDGVTVVTVQFWADYSCTVPSRLIEFHLELLDGEYRPLKTVVLSDTGLPTAS